MKSDNNKKEIGQDLEEDGGNPYLSCDQNNEQKALNVLSKMAKSLRTPTTDNEAQRTFEGHETAETNGNDSDKDV